MVRVTIRFAFTVVAAACLVVGSGCSRSPEAKKAQHLERGEKFFARKDYKDAVIEYRNVLRLEPANEVAIRKLGLAHYQAGELQEAFPYLRKAAELDPQNEDVSLKLATVYLVARRPDDARAQATNVLDRDAKNFAALLLLADSATRPEDVEAALARLESARSTVQDRAPFHIAVGTLYVKKNDAAKAEQAFKEAVARDPKSVAAHTALGQYYALVGDLNRTEEELKAAADLSPNGSPPRLQLADFYVRVGKRDAAKAVLTAITAKDPEYLPAWRRLAEIALLEGRYEESIAKLEPVLKKNRSDIEGLLVRGRIHLAKQEPTEAIAAFQTVVQLEPRLAAARYHLAVAQLQAGNPQQAKAELTAALAASPQFVDARLLLANLNIQSGSVQAAIEDLDNLTRSMPRQREAYRLLGTAHMRRGDARKATEMYRKFAELAPRDPQGVYLVGLGLRGEGKVADARKQFETALELAPGFVDPLAQLVNLKFADKDAAGAAALVQKQLAAVNNSGPLYQLLGEVYFAQGKRDDAEQAFLKAIELEPRLSTSYTSLATIYAGRKRLDEALAKLDEAHRLAPKSLTPLMMLGEMHQQRGDIAKAQEAYTKALSINPRFAPAANNLAWLYAEHDGDKDKALQLAQTAKEAAPDDPRISDTLAWILYKRGVYQRALALLEESAAKMPDEPAIQYHLGVVYAKVGNKDAARKALVAATSTKREFRQLADARRALTELN
jgi:putative PEP-CTERM system TPR-repeat lipoprotein